ncbi:MAG TPA: hypothetical protein VIG28_05235 [Leifsonia sp.]|jgi:hypothetical protein
MSIGPAWVAASVRARAIAGQGAGGARSDLLAGSATLEEALDRLADTSYGPQLRGAGTLSASQAAVTRTALWRLRVLAGWMPPTGMALARAAAAGFERENIVGHARGFWSASPEAAPFELGTLGTAWSRARETSSMDDLRAVLRRSAWGDPGRPERPGALMDVLTVSWLRRLAASAPGARPWASAACALLAARIVLADGERPSERLVALARPFIGTTWTAARLLADLASALPRSERSVLAGISEPTDLWRAEARLGAVVARDGRRLLGGSTPGPGVVVGALAVITVDAWRVRAGLAAAAAATGGSAVGIEVRRAMA